jgi:hypothetical protein
MQGALGAAQDLDLLDVEGRGDVPRPLKSMPSISRPTDGFRGSTNWLRSPIPRI